MVCAYGHTQLRKWWEGKPEPDQEWDNTSPRIVAINGWMDRNGERGWREQERWRVDG